MTFYRIHSHSRYIFIAILLLLFIVLLLKKVLQIEIRKKRDSEIHIIDELKHDFLLFSYTFQIDDLVFPPIESNMEIVM